MLSGLRPILKLLIVLAFLGQGISVSAAPPGRCSLVLMSQAQFPEHVELNEIVSRIQALDIKVSSNSNARIGAIIPYTERDLIWEGLTTLKNERPDAFEELFEIAKKYYAVVSKNKNNGATHVDAYKGFKRFFDFVFSVKGHDHQLFSGANVISIEVYEDYINLMRAEALGLDRVNSENSPITFLRNHIPRRPRFAKNEDILFVGSFFNGRAHSKIKSDIDVFGTKTSLRALNYYGFNNYSFQGLKISFASRLTSEELPEAYVYISPVSFSVSQPLIGSLEITMHLASINPDGEVSRTSYHLQGDTFVKVHDE